MARSRVRWVAVVGGVAVVLAASLVAPASSQAVNGVWTIAPIAVPTDTPMPGLNDVSCVTANWCMAVSGSVFAHWNGSAWSVAQPPDVSPYLVVNGVSCASTSWCVAVGHDDAASDAVIDSWNGTTWTPTSTPTSALTDTGLTAVSCGSPSFCVALGHGFDSQNVFINFVETWDGTAWAIRDLPAISGRNPSLNAVSCTGTAICMVVGATEAVTFGPYTPFVLGWDGTALTGLAAPPSPVQPETISCLSPSDCTSVGQNGITLIADRWNGSTWSARNMPNPGGTDLVADLSCASPTSCDVVGTREIPTTGYPTEQPLIERYNGSGWTVAGAPGLGPDSGLTGVSCLSATACVAVGSASNSSFDNESLVETNYQTETAHTTKVAVTDTPTTVLLGGRVTFTAKVSGSNGGGTVTFWRTIIQPAVAVPGCVAEPLVKVGTSYQATCTTTADSDNESGAEVQYSGSGVYLPSVGVNFVNVIFIDPTVKQLPDAVESRPYRFALTTSSYWSWSLIGGQLPPGLRVSSTGVIAGTPTLAGEYTFDVYGAPLNVRAGMEVLYQLTIQITH